MREELSAISYKSMLVLGISPTSNLRLVLLTDRLTDFV